MSKKDIEEFVEAPGRDDQVKEVRKKIDELGITYLYLQFVSVTVSYTHLTLPTTPYV